MRPNEGAPFCEGLNDVETSCSESLIVVLRSSDEFARRRERSISAPYLNRIHDSSLRKPIRWCVPTQNGLLPDPPQRHNSQLVAWYWPCPPAPRNINAPSASRGPFNDAVSDRPSLVAGGPPPSA